MRTLVVALLLLMAGLSGCAQQLNVRHLDRQPWTLATPATVTTAHWRFVYTLQPAGDGYAVRGQALPLRDNLPPWVGRIGQLELLTYIGDGQGRVVAQDAHSYPPQPLEDAGVPFQFQVRPAMLGAGRLSVTFGYRMSLLPVAAGDGRVFTANQTAVIRP